MYFIDAWCQIETFDLYVRRFQEAVSADYDRIRNGKADPFRAGRLLWRIKELQTRLPEITKAFRTASARIAMPESIEEYLNGKPAYGLSVLNDLAEALDGYPLPDENHQQAIQI